MRLNRLDLNLLVALDALLTERSITLAAKQIHLSQPATSGALARLREYFGDELLIRVGSKMKPTPLGESLAVPVHNILMQIRSTVESGVEFDAKSSDRTFRLQLSDYVSSTFMTHVAKKIVRLAPNIKLEYIIPDDNTSQSLNNGRVDFLLMPESVMAKHHPKKPLFQDEFVCLGWTENPFFSKPLTKEAFLAQGHVTVRFGANRARTIDQAFFDDQDLNYEVITSSFNAIPYFLPDTHRIATVYRELAEIWCRFLPLQYVVNPFEIPPVKWSLQWHQYRNLDPGMQWLSTLISETADELHLKK